MRCAYRFDGNMGGVDGEANLTASLRDLYQSLNGTTDAFPPFAFLTVSCPCDRSLLVDCVAHLLEPSPQILRQVAPQFAEMARGGPGGMGGGYAQQDAEEVWVRIINALQNSLPGLPPPSDSSASNGSAVQNSSAARKFVQQYMSGQMVIKRSCPEAPSEEPTYNKDNFTMLQCNISGTTNDMISGISDSLTQQIEKNSPSLGRTAVYDESSRIDRLPAYLSCHFVRFYWRRDINKKTKIMRKVKFPFDLDAQPFLSDELKKKVEKTSTKIKEVEKSRDERMKIRRRAKAKKENEEQLARDIASAPPADPAKAGTAGGSGGTDPPRPADPMAVDTAEDSLPKDSEPQLGALLTEQEEFELRAKEAAEVRATIDPELAADIGANVSGLYELVGIVTHKGAAADAGHYISWVKKDAADTDASTGAKLTLKDLEKPKEENWYKVSWPSSA